MARAAGKSRDDGDEGVTPPLAAKGSGRVAPSLDVEILKFISAHRSAASTDERFGALALKIFEHQFANNVFYRKFCQAEGGTPGRLAGWKDIPAMPAAGFKELVLTAFPQKKAVKIFRTSGTTSARFPRAAAGLEAPAAKSSADTSCGAHFFDTLALYEAALAPAFESHLLPDGAECAFFFIMASPEEAPHSSLSHMMGVVNRLFSRPRGKFYVKRDALLFDALVADLRAVRKRALLLSTAFSLKTFLDALAARKIRLKLLPGSRLMETGGFKGRVKEVSKAALYEACGDRLGIPRTHCVSEYGMTELSSQFYDAEAGRGGKRFFRGPAWTRTVVVDPRTGGEARKGKPGLLRHYDLANRGSVIAVETEDLGRVSGEGFELLGRAPHAASRGCSLAYEALIGG